jgi:superfamily II DNA or RNA helicase
MEATITGKRYNQNGITGSIVALPDASEALVVETVKKLSQLNALPDTMVLTTSRRGEMYWFKHPAQSKLPESKEDLLTYVSSVTQSWKDSFSFVKETKDKETKTILQAGLRNPQVGAIHAISAHWSIGHSPATIVMPTGTGKTETMLGVSVYHQCSKVLVVVPTDALRGQIANKFLSIGLLKEFGIVATGANNPVVCVLRHKPRNVDETEQIFGSCNVIVTSMSIAGACKAAVQQRMSELVSHLFIDEAHHIPAKTWSHFRSHFLKKPIVQFTATPFRNDGQHIDGRIIFNYPLAKAQEEEYFKAITFESVFEISPLDADKRIAEVSIGILRKDIENGFDHILMARVSSIKRTTEILPYYEKHADLNPVVIHSKLTAGERATLMSRILSGNCKIVICVNMLGEGFDLPQLKIAALHDMHKSLGITLQFTGRFTRNTNFRIGDATMVANIANPDVDKKVKSLYSEDADWNTLLRNRSTSEVEGKINLEEFISSFDDKMINEIPLQNLMPKMSTVIFQCKDSEKSQEKDNQEQEEAHEEDFWKPEDFKKVFDKIKYLDYVYTYSAKNNVLIIVTKQRVYVDWGNVKGVSNTIWELYIAYRDKDTNLLYISSSANELQEKLAEVISPGSSILKGDMMFRSFSGISRTVLFNVGLKSAMSGPIQYKMFSGTDLKDALSPANKLNFFKSNLFGIGYEDGEKASVGCSYKGKVWSYRTDNLVQWLNWCHNVGGKITDSSIDSEKVIEGLLKAAVVTARPVSMPITIEWPTSILNAPQRTVDVVFNGTPTPIYSVEISLLDPTVDGPLKFAVTDGYNLAEYELTICEPDEDNARGYYYAKISGPDVYVSKGTKNQPIIEWFTREGPAIRFLNTSYLENNVYVDASHYRYSPFDIGRIVTWQWPGINIKKESQYKKKDGAITHRAYSIQAHVISELKKQAFDIIFDDDDAGEAADVITFKVVSGRINLEFYHCKFSIEDTPGGRIDDFYVVCGQTQKSINWRNKIFDLIDHMLRRDSLRLQLGHPTRFEIGTKEKLADIRHTAEVLPAVYKMYIVQPGLDKGSVSESILQILGSTQGYLKDTYNLELEVISS